MKKITQILTVTAFAAMAQVSQAKSISIQIADVNEPTTLSLSIAPSYYSQDRYADLRARCSSYITDIEMAKRSALLKFGQGRIAEAAQILNSALQLKAKMIVASYRGMANPHTVAAIEQAAKVATVVMTETEKYRVQLEGNTDVLKLRMLEKLTQIVIDAHRDLDSRFFYNVIGQCHGRGCYNQSVYDLGFLPEEYYQGVSTLSSRFVQMYLDNSQLMAVDPLELSIASQTANAAARILSTSLFRRDFACPVTRLDDINRWINSELSSDPSYENLIMVTSETRAQMGWALNEIYSANCRTR